MLMYVASPFDHSINPLTPYYYSYQIAQQAFQVCLKHQRKVKFRRLCETQRVHLSNVAKYAHQPHAINTLQHNLDPRFAQLNTSVELELWQEAFRSVEDVHNLLIIAKKVPRPAMMANYYEKLLDERQRIMSCRCMG
jgi:translation initiation factor 3 subunit A